MAPVRVKKAKPELSKAQKKKLNNKKSKYIAKVKEMVAGGVGVTEE